jgi:hypothetical protein
MCASCTGIQNKGTEFFLDSSIALRYEKLNTLGTLHQVRSCCRSTILTHILHNPMMVCSDCKTMIKCFTDAKASQNYEVFCKSRNRKISAFEDSGIYFVLFNSFPETSRIMSHD